MFSNIYDLSKIIVSEDDKELLINENHFYIDANKKLNIGNFKNDCALVSQGLDGALTKPAIWRQINWADIKGRPEVVETLEVDSILYPDGLFWIEADYCSVNSNGQIQTAFNKVMGQPNASKNPSYQAPTLSTDSFGRACFKFQGNSFLEFANFNIARLQPFTLFAVVSDIVNLSGLFDSAPVSSSFRFLDGGMSSANGGIVYTAPGINERSILMIKFLTSASPNKLQFWRDGQLLFESNMSINSINILATASLIGAVNYSFRYMTGNLNAIGLYLAENITKEAQLLAYLRAKWGFN